MHAYVFVRVLTRQEKATLEKGARCSEGFVVRRSQMLLPSASGTKAGGIVAQFGCSHETVRQLIHAFNYEGLTVLQTKSHRPHQSQSSVDAAGLEMLRSLLHRSLRDFGKPTSLWPLELVVEVGHAQGITTQRVPRETIRQAIKRLDVSWKRAKHWTTSPDPCYARKKATRDRLSGYATTHADWVVGFADECWLSRFEQPNLSSWADTPLHLVQKTPSKDDKQPKALSCYGVHLLCPADPACFEQIWPRFVDGRPVSAVTTQFPQWVCQRLQVRGKRVWMLPWDNASWHISHEVRDWISTHNQRVKRCGVNMKAIYPNPRLDFALVSRSHD